MRQIVLMGGDARMRVLATELDSAGYKTSTFWQDGFPCPGSTVPGLSEADVLILPLPAFDANGAIRTACIGKPPDWGVLRTQIKKGCLLCGGGLNDVDWPEKVDLMRDEGFALANAVPTALAEGE